jgi:outer membrane protein
MNIQTLLAGACVAAISVTSTSAFAQVKPAQPAAAASAAAGARAPQITYGAAIPGVCTLDQRAPGATAAVQSVDVKIASEFQAEGQRLQQDLAPYDGKPAADVPDALKKRVEDLNNRVAARRTTGLLPAERQLQDRVEAAFAPTVVEVFQTRRCSLLIDRQAVVISNPAMDITNAVIARINQKVPVAGAAAPAAPR